MSYTPINFICDAIFLFIEILIVSLEVWDRTMLYMWLIISAVITY